MKFPERYRHQPRGFESLPGESGCFRIPYKVGVDSFDIFAIASNGEGWDHVSVSIPDRKRCPRWPEMCFVKDLFFSKEETVIQYHPPESEYVNNHLYCLHLWCPQNEIIPLPPSILVGIK